MPPPQFSVNMNDATGANPIHYSLTIDPSGGIIRRNIKIPPATNWVNNLGKSIDGDNSLMGKEIIRQAKENLILKLNNCLIPAGQIGHFTHDSVPDGWLVCDGSEYDPSLYPGLARAIGQIWGNNTQYLLPNLHNKFLRGTNDETQMFQLYENTNQSHNHDINGGQHAHYEVTMDNTGDHTHTIRIKSSSDYYTEYANDSAGTFNQTTLDSHYDNEVIRAGNPSQTGSLHEVGATFTGGQHSHGFTLEPSEIIPFRTELTGISENRPKNINLLTCIKY